jgi:hypothetical protein
MTIITTTIHVAADGAVSVADRLPQGDHSATITVTGPSHPRRSVREMRRHNLPWDGRISLHREDMYDENGRLR